MTDPSTLYRDLKEEIGTVLVGLDEQVRLLTAAGLTRGHVLLEGVPGVAKTSLAEVFARGMGLDHTRIQMTPDLLPADITGTKVFREHTAEFEIQRGPVFSNVVIADEINRAPPKTQSALLEAMEESNVTIEGETLALPDPFLVIATQNPLEMQGTFELPEAQRDRFQMKVTVDLPERPTELSMLQRFKTRPDLGPEDVGQVVTQAQFSRARLAVQEVFVDSSIEEYITDVVVATRDHSDTKHGGSPRATVALLDTARAWAAISGRDYVIPDDVKAVTAPVLAHRIILTSEAELEGRTRHDVVRDAVESVAPPGGGDVAADGSSIQNE